MRPIQIFIDQQYDVTNLLKYSNKFYLLTTDGEKLVQMNINNT